MVERKKLCIIAGFALLFPVVLKAAVGNVEYTSSNDPMSPGGGGSGAVLNGPTSGLGGDFSF